MPSFFRSMSYAALTAVCLTGCVSGVTRDGTSAATLNAPTAISTVRFGTKPVRVNVALNADAQKALLDNPKFDAKTLRGALENRLAAGKLLAAPDDKDAMQLNVEVTDIRVRSNLAATLAGFLAGNDHIDGKVTLLDAQNQPVDHFAVSTAYAWGGLIGGAGDTRTDWLYQKFADKTFVTLQPQE